MWDEGNMAGDSDVGFLQGGGRRGRGNFTWDGPHASVGLLMGGVGRYTCARGLREEQMIKRRARGLTEGEERYYSMYVLEGERETGV